jgi:hypothetical protein
MSIMLTKLSILAFYLKFLTTSPGLRRCIYALMVVVILYSVISSFVWLWACQPLEKYFDFTITYGTCLELTKVTVLSAMMNCVTDTLILIFPLLILRGSRLPLRQKIGVAFILMSGGLYVI